MQWKILPPSRLADRFNRWGIRRGFPALAWLAPRAPRWFLLFGARVVISVVMFLHFRPKAAIARNLARILELPEDSPAVRRGVRQMLYHFAYAWVDLFRFAQLPHERLRPILADPPWSSLERLRALAGAGPGAILITGHLGNWEIGGVLLGQLGLPLSVVYVRDQFVEAEHFRSLFRRFGQVEEIALDLEDRLASLPALQALKAGRLVALQGDRDFNDRGEPMAFFDAPVSFPTGPFHLARMTGSPLLPVFIAYTKDRRLEIEVGEEIRVERSADRDEDVRRALAAWVAVLEKAVRRWPTQWHAFYDYWPPGNAPHPVTPEVAAQT